ncbi:MAG TPA: hypothetical protein VMM56_16540, partial [Planctomycetaceae bacterium]|nr:hypothetical protein [Planctomycetaceae bacterium]
FLDPHQTRIHDGCGSSSLISLKKESAPLRYAESRSTIEDRTFYDPDPALKMQRESGVTVADLHDQGRLRS